MPERRTVALVTLGCARNEVDSEELAGRLHADGWELVQDAAEADVAVVNTCGFVEAAKKDSVDALLEAADLKGRGRTQAVVAVGCMAERYGKELAEALPEADAVLGFDRERASVVLNRADPRAGLKPGQVGAVLGHPIDFQLPADSAVPATVNRGVPAVCGQRRSPFARAFEPVASELLGAGGTTAPVRSRRQFKLALGWR